MSFLRMWFSTAVFSHRYQDLMDKGEERKRKLEDSIQRYSLLRDAHELESWINDKVNWVKLLSFTHFFRSVSILKD